MRKGFSLLILCLLAVGLCVFAQAEGDTMDVMQTILSVKKQMPDKVVFDNIAIRSRQEMGMGIREISYRWDAGKFTSCVTFGSTLSSPMVLKDENGRFQSVCGEAEYSYLLYLPEHYDESRVYPTILFLHGIGERGDDPAVIAAYGPFQYLLSGGTLDAIIIAPQCEKSAHWVEDENENETDAQMKRLALFIDQMKEKYPIDEDRLYLTGLSMGGRGAYKLACFLPDTFAAVAVCCGRAGVGDDPAQIYYDLSKMASKPVWIFHGLSDATVDPNHSLRAAERLLSLNDKGDFRLTLYPAVGHGCYEHAYRNAELYTWMLSFKRETK